MAVIKTKTVPKIRFHEFNDEWQEKTVGELGRFIGGGTPSKKIKKYWSGQIPWVSSSDIPENDIGHISYTRFITHEAVSNSATKIIPVNSVLVVSRVGVGKLAVNNRIVCTSQDFTNIIPGSVNTIFLAYLLKRNKSKLLGFNQGTSIKGFTTNNLAILKVYVPSENEQQKIAAFLTAVDDKCNLLQQKIDLLKKYKKGLLQQIFSQKLRFKDDNGKEYPEWEEKKFSNCLESLSIRPYKIQIAEIKDYGKYPVVDQGQKEIAGYSDLKTKIFKNIPVIVFGDHTTFLKYIDYEFIIGADGTKLLKSKDDNSRYLYYYLEFNKIKPEGYKRHFSILKKIRLQIPSKEEQAKIANLFRNIDSKINLEESKLEQVKNFKSSLLQQMLI